MPGNHPGPGCPGPGFSRQYRPDDTGPGRRCQSLTEREVRDFRRERITHFKVRHYIRFVDEYPMTVTGKIQTFNMRETMIAKPGLGQP